MASEPQSILLNIADLVYDKDEIELKVFLILITTGFNKMKVVILVGGFGTRLGEETDLIPKPMVKIGKYPILWHIMKIYAAKGLMILQWLLVINRKLLKTIFTILI